MMIMRTRFDPVAGLGVSHRRLGFLAFRWFVRAEGMIECAFRFLLSFLTLVFYWKWEGMIHDQ